MFGGGVLVTPLVGLGPEGSPVPMALVVAGGAVLALLATVLLTRSGAKGQAVLPAATAGR
jgi:DHA1 family bicyclomycin/chloramphenicol resistance-like MFS transporter